MSFTEPERVVATIEELDFGSQQFCGSFGFVLAARLDLFQRRAGLFPCELTLAALAVGQAHDLDAVAAFGMESYCAACAPYEIARVCGDDKSGLTIRHCAAPFPYVAVKLVWMPRGQASAETTDVRAFHHRKFTG